MASQQNNRPITEVRVVDFDMSIISLIGLFLKMAIAAIPAMIIIWGFTFAVTMGFAVLMGVGGSLIGG